MRSKSINPVKGTLSVHSVFVVDNNTIATRKTSCFENCCFSSGEFRMGEHDQDDKWCKHSLRQVNADLTEGEVDTDTENMQTSNVNIELSFSVEDFVAALYTDNDGEIQWYIWKIKETDQNDKEVYITFMTTSEIKGKMTFRWPSTPDEIWVEYKEVLCRIDAPELRGSRRQVYKLKDEDITKIRTYFDQRME